MLKVENANVVVYEGLCVIWTQSPIKGLAAYLNIQLNFITLKTLASSKEY